MSLLVDTNVVGELARPAPDAGVLTWAGGVHEIFLSAVSLEEIAYGLGRRPNPRIEHWFHDFLKRYCAVLPVTDTIARISGRLRAELAGRGQVRTQADMLIAATAQAHGHTLVTRNARDFDGCGIALLNPFSV